MTTEWILVLIGLIGILSGIIGQAIFWGVFKGAIEAKVKSVEGGILKLEKNSTDTWKTINEHGQRIATIESACGLNHRSRRQ